MGGVEDAAAWSGAAVRPRVSCHRGGSASKNNFIPTRNGKVFAAADSREGEMLRVKRGDVAEPDRCGTSSSDGADGKLRKHLRSANEWLNPWGMGVEVGKAQAGGGMLQ